MDIKGDPIMDDENFILVEGDNEIRINEERYERITEAAERYFGEP